MWTIHFPPGSGKSCLQYWVEGTDCGSVPASFCLVSVLALDSDGEIDTLQVENATLLGGTADTCPAPLAPRAVGVLAVRPNIFSSGRTSVVTVTGRGLDENTWVQFRDHAGQVLPSEIGFATTDTLRAVFAVPEAAAGRVSMQLTRTDGSSESIDSIGTVVAPEFYVTVLIDGAPAAPDNDQGTNAGGPLCPTPLHAPSVFRTLPSVIRPDSGCNMTQVIRSNTITYIVHRSYDDAVMTNCYATIAVSAWAASGGHCHHDSSRPYGSPDTASGNTGADGQQFRVTHTWPQVSGYLLVQLQPDAECIQRWGYSENLWIPIRGPDAQSSTAGLLNMEDGFGYTVTGGDDNVSRHPDNHYGTPELVATLQNMAYLWGGPVLGRPNFGYNDLSLMWGGVFDVEQVGVAVCRRPPNWVSPCHCGHRKGTQVDFKITQFINLDQRRRANLLVKKYFDVYTGESVAHWHLTLKKAIP
jgi:hypothetical protein